MARLKDKFKEEVAKMLTEKFGYKNVMEIPKIEKVILNMGVGEAVGNPKALDAAVNDMTIIAGQKPVVTRAKNPSRHLRFGKVWRSEPK
jgi:large subunit ribosomal protein L5